MDRLAEIEQYNSAFRGALTDEDFLAAGYTPEEISAYRSGTPVQTLTPQDVQASQAQYGTLTAPDYTIRDTATQRVQDALIQKAGMEPYQAGVYARRIMGDPNAQGVLDSLGLADLTPAGAVFAVEEGAGTAMRGYQQGDPLAMGLGALEAGLGIAEAFPLTKAISRGIASTVSKMDPNTLYSVFGPPSGSRAPLSAAEDVAAPTGFRAFHGSPYEFESFDFSKMGTGEGAQAYGRGGYFASEADVARGYKPAGDLMVGKKSVSNIYDSISSRADRLPPKAAEAEYNKMAVLEDLMNDGDVLAVRERAAGGAYDQDAMDWFEKEIAPNFKGSGSLYEVNIRANPEEFLDWEKPLSEQPKAVLEALDPFIQERIDSIVAAGERGRQIAKEKGLPDFTPKSREQIFAQLRGGDIAASGRLGQSSFSEDVLKEAGVPGIKYLDPQSRSQNYVVFDQNLIDIVKKYGIAGAAAILGVSALDVEQAIAANVPQSELDQLAVGQ